MGLIELKEYRRHH